ncbi:hypothetical protein [Cytobacillus oceanisediminis]|uniref:hypothetical protein n=1 Tax=Cytobacillus oceanisediminis TaxID=665099 RepID=UPI001FB53E2D|nr:hypothetical protein [Cytobacillus oceanisediminis]UOE58025.1 hypothetical protein IRB79_27565 [Cytobacillus oceanisediminis]
MKIGEGWFWSNNFFHWQKRKEKVYCYVTPILGGVKAQLYMTGTASFCELEARTDDSSHAGLYKMMALAESWLEMYSEGELDKIHQDKYSIHNPNGVWKFDTEKKEWWI